MLQRTQRNIIIVFAIILVAGITYFLYSGLSGITSNLIPKENKFIKNISFFFTPHRGDSPVNASISIDWFNKMKKESVENKANFQVRQVKLEGKTWQPVENGKKFTINTVQYVYAPWVDTEKKRKMAKPEERDRKVTQIFLEVVPPAERNEFVQVLVKNVEDASGNKPDGEEYAVVQVTDFNKLIQR
jgi:hypothetical protein